MLPMASTGLVNWIYAIGDLAVLRIPSGAHPDGVADAYTESVAVPAVRAAGVSTPALLAFDTSYDVLDVPYTIYERVPGRDLSGLPVSDPSAEHVYRQLGRELARLHRDVTEVADPHHRLDGPDRWHSPDFTRDLLDKGFIDGNSADVVRSLFERLRPSLPDSPTTFRRFLHQDLKTSNLMGHQGQLAAIIDWGDAGWGDPALEFRYLPMRAVEAAVAGYREIMPIDGDDTAEARILWDQIWVAVWQLDRHPEAAPRGSNRDRPGSRLIDLVGFLTSARGRHWVERSGLG